MISGVPYSENRLILVTGTTGYVARLLVPCLLAKGYRVRCLVRGQHLEGRDWYSQVEVVRGDVTARETLDRAMEGVSAAYYLVHSMASGRCYHLRDLDGARNFTAAAGAAQLEQIIYLGGLADPHASIGFHMRSRIETGDALRQGPVPVTEFRAGVIIGPGSISFEMIRYLTEQFPILVGPRWVLNCSQPIAVQNVIDYLLNALEIPHSKGKIYEIGGVDVLTYREEMLHYARARGLKRRMVVLPYIPPWLMALAIDRLTPVPYNIARPLVDGMRSDSVVCDRAARDDFPQVEPLGYQEAVTAALSQLSPETLDRSWHQDGLKVKTLRREGFLIECRQAGIEGGDPEAVYRAFTSLGGDQGWLALNPLWKLRGLLDRALGGPGLRGRPGGAELCEGDILDFYRVEVLKPGHMMRLRAELKAPGTGWMEWRIRRQEGKVLLSQVAFFAPKGLPGFLYWFLLYPVHHLVFARMFSQLLIRAGEIQKDGYSLIKATLEEM